MSQFVASHQTLSVFLFVSRVRIYTLCILSVAHTILQHSRLTLHYLGGVGNWAGGGGDSSYFSHTIHCLFHHKYISSLSHTYLSLHLSHRTLHLGGAVGDGGLLLLFLPHYAVFPLFG